MPRSTSSPRSALLALLILPLLLNAQTPNSWTTGTPMPTPRNSPFVGVVNNLIYVIGGRGLNYANFSVNEIYNPSTNTWSTGAPMPTPRVNGASAVANNIIYAIGGIGNPGAAGTYSIVEAYDPATDTWSAKASMPIPVFDAYAVVYNGYIYVVGGAAHSYSGKLNTLLAYQLATNTWTTLAPLIVQKSGYGLGLFGSRIIAAGGATGNAVVSDNEAYDIPSNTWTTITPLPKPRFNGCSGAIGNMLYFGGGQTAFSSVAAGGVPVNTLDAYDPRSLSE